MPVSCEAENVEESAVMSLHPPLILDVFTVLTVEESRESSPNTDNK